MSIFGDHLRKSREAKRTGDTAFSVRGLAAVVGVEPSYLSKVERGLEAPPSEARILALAKALGEDPDVMLALAGKVSSELMDIIRQRPELFGQLLRELRTQPSHAVLRIVRDVRDGQW
jgi:HTH-type transcriptional regulator, competence development regulator